MGFKSYVKKKTFLKEQSLLIEDIHHQFSVVDKLYLNYDEIVSRFLNIISEDEDILNIIEAEDNALAVNAKEAYKKLHNSFYTMLRYPDLKNLGRDLEEEFVVEGVSISADGEPRFFCELIKIVNDKAITGSEEYTNMLTEPVVLVEFKRGEGGQFIYNDKGIPVLQRKIERREELTKFFPILKDVLNDEEDLKTLHEALRTIEETCIILGNAIEHFEHKIMCVQNEDIDELKEIDNYAQDYLEFRSQI